LAAESKQKDICLTIKPQAVQCGGRTVWDFWGLTVERTIKCSLW